GGIRVGPRITITLAHGPQLGFVFLYFINLGLGNPPQAGASHLQVFLGGLGLRGLTAGIRGGIGLAAGDLLFAASYRLVGLLGRFGYLLGGPGWLAGLFGRGPVGPLSFLQVSQGLDLVKIIFDALDRRLLVAGAVFPPHRAVTAGVGLEGGPVYGVIGQSTSPGSTNFSMICVKIPLIPPDARHCLRKLLIVRKSGHCPTGSHINGIRSRTALAIARQE